MALQLFITVLQPTGDTAHVMTLQVLHLPVVFHWQFLAGSRARCLLEQAVAAPLEEAYIVNTSEMPLFQFLSAPCRAAAARRRPQSLPLLELELVYPAFASQPVNNLAICIQWFAKKPKQLPQPRFHHLPLAVPEDAASSLTLTFQLLSGEDLASCVVAIPWVCNFEVLSHQLEVDMKLIHVVITPSVKGFLSCEALAEIGHEGTVHVGALALVKPGSLTLQCLRKSVVNLRTALDPPSMPTGWRRWYHEFKSLVTSLPLVPFEVVASDGTPTFVLDRFGEAPVVELACIHSYLHSHPYIFADTSIHRHSHTYTYLHMMRDDRTESSTLEGSRPFCTGVVHFVAESFFGVVHFTGNGVVQNTDSGRLRNIHFGRLRRNVDDSVFFIYFPLTSWTSFASSRQRQNHAKAKGSRKAKAANLV